MVVFSLGTQGQGSDWGSGAAALPPRTAAEFTSMLILPLLWWL